VNNNNSNKRRKSDEWVLLKRSRFDSTQNSILNFISNNILIKIILVPPVQSILPNTSTTTIDESAATSDVKIFKSNFLSFFFVFSLIKHVHQLVQWIVILMIMYWLKNQYQ